MALRILRQQMTATQTNTIKINRSDEVNGVTMSLQRGPPVNQSHLLHFMYAAVSHMEVKMCVCVCMHARRI